MTSLTAAANPRARLAAAGGVLLVTALAARRGRVSDGEAEAFRAVNGLPGSLYPVAWTVMQMGALGAAPAAAGAAWLAGDRKLAGQLLASGASTWAAAKLVKRIVRRPRPAALLSGTHRRGPAAAGLGYLSGHAGVAASLGAGVLPHLGPTGRTVTLVAIPAVGLTRIYVGAHFPLDIIGGAALGVAVDAAVQLAGGRAGRSSGGGVITCPQAHPGRASGNRIAECPQLARAARIAGGGQAQGGGHPVLGGR